MNARFLVGETVVVLFKDGRRPRTQLAAIDGPIELPAKTWTVRLHDGSIETVPDDWILERALLVRYPCQCCGHLSIVTFGHGPPGTYAICPVCGWEDDYINREGAVSGANDRRGSCRIRSVA